MADGRWIMNFHSEISILNRYDEASSFKSDELATFYFANKTGFLTWTTWEREGGREQMNKKYEKYLEG